MERRDFVFDSVDILDWYDGAVLAIGEHQQIDYLLILVAWDIKSKCKAYVVLQLDSAIAKSMRQLTVNAPNVEGKQKDWETFNTILNDYLGDYQDEAYITLGEPNQGRKSSAKPISSVHLSKLKNYDIENALTEEAITLWLSLVGDRDCHQENEH
jgi:hypothetical protein